MPTDHQKKQWDLLVRRNGSLESFRVAVESGHTKLRPDKVAQVLDQIDQLINLEEHFYAAPNIDAAEEILAEAKRIILEPGYRTARKGSSAVMLKEFFDHAPEAGAGAVVSGAGHDISTIKLMREADSLFWSHYYHGRGPAVAKALSMQQFPGFEATFSIKVGLDESEKRQLVQLAEACLQLLDDLDNKELNTSAYEMAKSLRPAIVKAKNEAYDEVDAASSDTEGPRFGLK